MRELNPDLSPAVEAAVMKEIIDRMRTDSVGRAKAWAVMAFALAFPSDRSAELNIVTVDRVVAGAELVFHLGGIREERKAVLAVSEGWMLYRPSRSLPSSTTEQLNLGSQFQSRCDADRQALSMEDHERGFRNLLDDANRQNVSFYPLDPRGLVVFDQSLASGFIDANVDDNNQSLTCKDYERNGYTLEAYLAAYDWEMIDPLELYDDHRFDLEHSFGNRLACHGLFADQRGRLSALVFVPGGALAARAFSEVVLVFFRGFARGDRGRRIWRVAWIPYRVDVTWCGRRLARLGLVRFCPPIELCCTDG